MVLISSNLEAKSMMLRVVNGTRRRSKQRTGWLNNIKADTMTSIQQLK